ncbi:ZBED5 protein, partial [Amia calva]|nr:ZBED5 protein [Amia calva]
ALKKTVSILCGKSAAEQIALIPVSDDTVSNRIGRMAKDVEEQVIDKVKCTVHFSLKLDETTDVSGDAQVLVYARFVEEGEITEDFFATSARLFKILCQEMGAEHHQLFYHSKVRWLPKGNVLSRLYELRDEVRAFLLEKNYSLAGNFQTNNMDQKIRLWQTCLDNENFEAFSALEECLNDSMVSKADLCVLIQAHLDGMITQFREYIPVCNERLRELNLFTLEQRRQCGDLIQVFNIMKGIDHIKPEEFFQISRDTRTRGHKLKLGFKAFKTENKRHFFTQRGVTIWNKLPSDVAEAENMGTFKIRLDRILGSLSY